MLVDVSALRKRFAAYPNILRYIEMLLRHQAYPMLERIQAATPKDIAEAGMTLEDLDNLAGMMIGSQSRA